MKKSLSIIIFCFAITIFLLSSSVLAQTAEFDQFYEAFKKLYRNPTDCDGRLKDAQGNCLQPQTVIEACLAEGKRNKDGAIDPACCITDDQCRPNETCTIGNSYCRSGLSCENHQINTGPGNQPAPTTSVSGRNPTFPPRTNITPSTDASGQPRIDNFPYFCQGYKAWRTNCHMGTSGCGPTTMAMILNYFGKTEYKGKATTPDVVDAAIQATGARSCGGGTSFMYGYKNTDIFNGFWAGDNLVQNGVFNAVEAKKQLDAGALIAGSSSQFVCGASCDPYINKNCANKSCNGTLYNSEGRKYIDHIFIIQKIENPANFSTCTVKLRDPSNCTYPEGHEDQRQGYMYRKCLEINGYAFAFTRPGP